MDAMARKILPCCLPCRKARAGQDARHDAGHGTPVIVGHRLSFDNVWQIRRSSSRGTPQFVASTLGPLSGAKRTLSGPQARLNWPKMTGADLRAPSQSTCRKVLFDADSLG